MRRTSLIATLAGSALLAAGGLGAAGLAAGGSSITLNSASATAKGVNVGVTVSGWKMYPALVGKKPNKSDGGHWHIFFNGKYVNASALAKTGSVPVKAYKTAKFKAGQTVKVTVQLANNDHSPVGKASASKSVTLK